VSSPTNTGWPAVVMPRGQYRLGRGADVVSEQASVEEQVIQLDLVEATLLPLGHLGPDLGADPRHRRARHGGLLSEGLGQGGLHVPGRQAADEPGDDQALQRASST